EINTPIEGSTFDLEFPLGTRVSDRSNPNAPREYILKDDGRKRPILRDDIGATYQQMIQSEPGEALRKWKSSFVSWPTTIAVVALVVAIGLLLWRRGVFRRDRVK